jgi:hypothetical protein
MCGGTILLGDNINAIIWLDDNILLFDRTYNWAGIILYVPSDRMKPLMLSTGWMKTYSFSIGDLVLSSSG